MSVYAKVSCALVLCLALLATDFAQGEVFVGIKEGDWIEYAVSTSGEPPKEIEVVWAKMEIIKVQETKIMANVTTKAVDDKLSSIVMIFNLTKGQVGAWFIIPAGLNIGDCFWDDALGRNVTIEGEELLAYAGATRLITNATTPERLKHWDKATGVFVECVDVLDDYSINATAIKTNMWGTHEIELQQNTPPAIWLVIVIAIVSAVLLIVLTTKKEEARS